MTTLMLIGLGSGLVLLELGIAIVLFRVYPTAFKQEKEQAETTIGKLLDGANKSSARKNQRTK